MADAVPDKNASEISSSASHPPATASAAESAGSSSLGIRVNDVHSLGGKAPSATVAALGISVDEALLLCSSLANELRSLYHGLAGNF
jgi:hypothetical protein